MARAPVEAAGWNETRLFCDLTLPSLTPSTTSHLSHPAVVCTPSSRHCTHHHGQSSSGRQEGVSFMKRRRLADQVAGRSRLRSLRSSARPSRSLLHLPRLLRPPRSQRPSPSPHRRPRPARRRHPSLRRPSRLPHRRHPPSARHRPTPSSRRKNPPPPMPKFSASRSPRRA